MKRIYGLSLALLLCGAPLSLAAQDSEPVPSPTSPQTGDITQTLERQAPSPLPLMLPVLGDPVDPSGFFFVAEEMRNQAKETGVTPDQQLSEFMYTLAFRFAKSPAAEEAGKSLFSLLSNQGRLSGGSIIAREWIQVFGLIGGCSQPLCSLWHRARFRGPRPVPELSKALPSAAKSRFTELSWMEYNARSAMQDFSWAENGLPFIKTRIPDAYIANIYRLYAAAPNVPQNIAALALFRAAATEKKYAEAVGCATPILPTFAMPDTPRAWISELGRSFYGTGAWQQGLDFFSTALGLEIRSPKLLHTGCLTAWRPPVPMPPRRRHCPQQPTTPESALPALERARIPRALVGHGVLSCPHVQAWAKPDRGEHFYRLVPLAFSGGTRLGALVSGAISRWIRCGGRILCWAIWTGRGEAMHAKRALEISRLSGSGALDEPFVLRGYRGGLYARFLREGAWDDVVSSAHS